MMCTIGCHLQKQCPTLQNTMSRLVDMMCTIDCQAYGKYPTAHRMKSMCPGALLPNNQDKVISFCENPTRHTSTLHPGNISCENMHTRQCVKILQSMQSSGAATAPAR
eukprot:8942202-Karenia_brevis.AAC.1